METGVRNKVCKLGLHLSPLTPPWTMPGNMVNTHTPTRSPSLLHLQLLPAGVIVLSSQNISESPSVTRIESKREPGGSPPCVWGSWHAQDL